MTETDSLKRLENIEKRLDRIEKRLEKTEKERELTLKEKFTVHDCAQGVREWFEKVVVNVSDDTLAKELREIVNRFSELVDKALGVKFP